MVAAAKGKPPASFPAAAAAWLKKTNLEVDGDLLTSARKAVARVASNSELKELWEESGQKDDWYKSIGDLEQRLA
jgi:hypothetical protein